MHRHSDGTTPRRRGSDHDGQNRDPDARTRHNHPFVTELHERVKKIDGNNPAQFVVRQLAIAILVPVNGCGVNHAGLYR